MLSVDDILDYIDTILTYLVKNNQLVSSIVELYRQTSEYPDALLDKWFASMPSTLNRKAARQMIDSELSYNGRKGSDFLNGWVKADGETAYIRAMPTRQLHITAGNVPEVPIISALRAVLTKSAAVIKQPYGAILPGMLFAIAASEAAPEHPSPKTFRWFTGRAAMIALKICCLRRRIRQDSGVGRPCYYSRSAE
jgi:hypothetical protein